MSPVDQLETYLREYGAQVHARGGVVTVKPTEPDRGSLVARFPSSKGGQYVYEAAPPEIQAARAAVLLQEREDISAADRYQAVVNALSAARSWAAGLPRRLISDVTGLPTWMLSALILALAVGLIWKWTRPAR